MTTQPTIHDSDYRSPLVDDEEDAKPPVMMRALDDIDSARDWIMGSVEASVASIKPVEYGPYTLEIKDVHYTKPASLDYGSLKKSILGKGSITTPLWGTVNLYKDGALVDTKSKLLANVPTMTKHGTFIKRGIGYGISNQSRLRSGIYSRVKSNGLLESHFNPEQGTGQQFRLGMDPSTGVFHIDVAQAKLPLLPILRAVGVDDEQMQKAWGDEIFRANASRPSRADVLKKAVARLTWGRGKKELSPDDDPSKLLREALDNARLDSEVTARTMGKPYDRISPEALLHATRKLLDLNGGKGEPDNRESLANQRFLGPEDLIAERIIKGGPSTIRKAMRTIARKNSLEALPAGVLTQQIEGVFQHSGLASPLEETNLTEVIDTMLRVSKLGQGAIGSTDAIPDESRGVHATQFGFIDPIRSPESDKIGVDLRLNRGVMKGADGQLYSPMINVRSGATELLPSGKVEDVVIALKDEPDPDDGKIPAIVKGKLDRVDASEVDYRLNHPENAYTFQTLLMPALSQTSGGRIVLGSKFISQAIPLERRESPLVRVAAPGGDGSMEEIEGSRIGAIKSDVAGSVVSVDGDNITVKTDDGQTKQYDLANWLPHNRRSFMLHKPKVAVGDRVEPGQMLATSNITDDEGVLALGTNLRVAYTPFNRDGSVYEDSIVISESAAKKLASQEMYTKKVSHKEGEIGKNRFRAIFPGTFDKAQVDSIDDNGVVKPGTTLQYGDPIVLAVQDRGAPKPGMGYKGSSLRYRNAAATWDHEYPGYVTDSAIGPQGANVAIAVVKPAEEGTKLSGRHGDKGIVSMVLPDGRMPQDQDGNPFDILVNPLGIQSRGNPSQVVEAALGKIARATGKHVTIPSFYKGDYIKMAKEALAEHGLSPTEDIYDPVLNRTIKGVNTGVRYYYRLHHDPEKKLAGRGEGIQYTFEGTPGKGGKMSAPRFGLMELNALVAANAGRVLQDSHLFRGQRNEDYWRMVKMGHPAPTPRNVTMLGKFTDILESAGINVRRDGKQLHVMAMTDGDIDARTEGREIKNAETVKIPSLDPIEGGLFDRSITGGHGGNKMARIELGVKIPHPVMEEPIRHLLGLTSTEFRDILSGSKPLNGKNGPEAIESALRSVKVQRDLDLTRQAVRTSKATARDKAIKKLRVLDMMNRLDIEPHQFMLSKLPVLPPQHRPISLMEGVPLVNPINALYKDLFTARDNYHGVSRRLGQKGAGEEMLALYDSAAAVIGLGDPVGKESQERGAAGLLKVVFGEHAKHGMFQKKMLGTNVDLGGRGVISADPSLNMNQVGVPEDMAWEVFSPFIMRRLVRRGMKPLEAAKAVKERKDVAKKSLLEEMKHRPVLLNRAPTLHRYGIMGAWPVLSPGKTIRVSPVVTPQFGADFDGDQQINQVFLVLDRKIVGADKSRYGNLQEIPMPTYFKQSIPLVDENHCLHIVDLADVPHGELIGEKDHIRFYKALPGMSVVAVDEATGNPVLAEVHGWSEHVDREVEIVTLSSGKQILTDDDERAVYGLDGDTLQWCRRRPSQSNSQFVPVWANCHADMQEIQSVALPGDKSYRMRKSASLDFNTGYLVGAMAGNGWVEVFDDVRRSACFCSNDEGAKKAFVDSLSSIFEETPHIGTRNQVGDGTRRKMADSTTLVVSCVAFGQWISSQIGEGARNKRLPTWCLAAPRECKIGMLAGLWDTDGSVSISNAKSKPQFMLNYSSSSIRLVQMIQHVLRSLGVQSTITASSTPGGLEFWVLNVSSPDLYKIGGLPLRHGEKRLVMEAFLKAKSPRTDGAYSRFRLMPIPKALAVDIRKLIPCTADRKMYNLISDCVRNGSTSKNSAIKILDYLAEKGLVCEHPLFKMWAAIARNSSVHFEKVVSVEKTGRKETGHDLTVPGYETFSSVDGVVLSNTMAIHVPASEGARKEIIEKLMPGNQLLDVGRFKAQFMPRQEFSLGLWYASRAAKNKKGKRYDNMQDVIRDFKTGKLNIDDVVDIAEPPRGSTVDISSALKAMS